jgi:DNA-binding beta-propeller fold protein YncE
MPRFLLVLSIGACLCACATPRGARDAWIPTGVRVTPLAVPGSTFEELDPLLPGAPGLRAGQPAALAISPDGSLLATLTSGFNKWAGADGSALAEGSTEWLFLHRLEGGAPRFLQAIAVPATFLGLAWAPDGSRLYASGGADDCVHEYAPGPHGYAEVLPAIALGHGDGLGVGVKPMVAGLAVGRDGERLVAADFENDSISVVDTRARAKVASLDLRPGKSDPAQHGKPGGEYPIAAAFTGPATVWIASVRDREAVEVELAGPAPAVRARVAVGEQPVALLFQRGLLQVVNSGSDSLDAIDPAARRVVRNTPLAPLFGDGQVRARGLNANAIAAGPSGELYVTLGALNAVAVLQENAAPQLLPTGWYPQAAAFDARAGRLLVATGRSDPGPNPLACRRSAEVKTQVAGDKGQLPQADCRASNSYVWQLIKGGLSSLPLPDAATARQLTAQVETNARAPGAQPAAEKALFEQLRGKVKHVIYIVKENRSYDQLLGDIAGADGDPRLTLFPERITPNHHAIVRSFVLLDRFFVSGHSSGDGWNWSTAARTSHLTELLEPVQYAGRGGSYDYEGQNRNVNVALPKAARRAENPKVDDDDDLLPGSADVARPGGESGAGYLWSAALRKGITLRNYGFFGEDMLYDPGAPGYLPPSHAAFAEQKRQFWANEEELQPLSDPWFRTFDMKSADYWNYKEWEREFDGYAARGDLPGLSLVRLAHDHMGSFKEAADGVDTPDTQVADNDYALGLLVEKVSKSPFARDTVILGLEDDAQDGPDHVSAQRSFLIAAGAHVRQGGKSSRPATTVDVLRTIEELLGLEPLSHTDGFARPLAELFTAEEQPWSYTARVPGVLRSTQLPLPPPGPQEKVERPRGDRLSWDEATKGQEFSKPDQLDTGAFNRALVQGLSPAQPEREE